MATVKMYKKDNSKSYYNNKKEVSNNEMLDKAIEQIASDLFGTGIGGNAIMDKPLTIDQKGPIQENRLKSTKNISEKELEDLLNSI